jgi:hypothetical protein
LPFLEPRKTRPMDMNQLLHAHQIAVIGKARTTASAPRAA